MADLQPLQLGILHPDRVWRQNSAAETNRPGKKGKTKPSELLEYSSKHLEAPAGLVLGVQCVEEQTVDDLSLLVDWRHLQQGSSAELHAPQLVG